MASHHRPPCPRPSPTASRPTFTPARHDQIPLAAAYPDHVSQDGGTAAPARPALAAALGRASAAPRHSSPTRAPHLLAPQQGRSARAAERADALAFRGGVGHDGATSTTDSDQPMRLAPPGRPHWTSPGWSNHDLRAATPAAERCPGRDAGPAQSPACRSRARRQWSPLPGVHHPRHRHPGGTLALPDSRGRRGRTGHNLRANAALAHHSPRLSPKTTRSSARDSRSVVKYATRLHDEAHGIAYMETLVAPVLERPERARPRRAHRVDPVVPVETSVTATSGYTPSEQAAPALLIIDLAGLQFVDSTGVR